MRVALRMTGRVEQQRPFRVGFLLVVHEAQHGKITNPRGVVVSPWHHTHVWVSLRRRWHEVFVSDFFFAPATRKKTVTFSKKKEEGG